jgi:hypothetical protein
MSEHSQTLSPVQMIQAATPRWLLDAPAARRAEIKGALRTIPVWLRNGGSTGQQAAHRAVARAWQSQNQVDRMLESIRDIRVFARSQLQAELARVLKCSIDVEQTWLRLYIPVISGSGFTTRTLSMLDAALMNFELKETRDDYFDEASCFISPPSSDGRFAILPRHQGLTVQSFARLCRRLDIGQRFQNLLSSVLTPTDGVARHIVAQRFTDSQNDALMAAAHLALLKGDIARPAFKLLQALGVGLAGLGKSAVRAGNKLVNAFKAGLSPTGDDVAKASKAVAGSSKGSRGGYGGKVGGKGAQKAAKARSAPQQPAEEPRQWTVTEQKLRGFKQLNQTETDKWNSFRSALDQGMEPKVAANLIGDSNFKLLKGSQFQIRLSLANRVTFEIDYKARLTSILQVGGHT